MAGLRIVQYGCGKASELTMKYVFDSGCEIVGAFDNDPNVIGKDIGDIMNTEKKGVIVENASHAEELLKDLRPDACIVTTMSLLRDIEDTLMLMAKLGINTVTSCEEAFFPWNSSPEIAQKIDELAKKNNCTICGTGYQDMSWCNLAVVLAGSCNKIDSIKITTSFNLDNYGIAPALIHGAGMHTDDFAEDIAAISEVIGEEPQPEEIRDFMPSFAWNSNGWLCDKMGLTVKNQSQRYIPHTYDAELQSKALGMNILAGYVMGMTAIAVTETEEGVTIITESIGKIYTSDESDVNVCEIKGEPNISCVLERPENVNMACAAIVGRIPDVVNAPAGFVPSSKMPMMTYKCKELSHYIDK